MSARLNEILKPFGQMFLVSGPDMNEKNGPIKYEIRLYPNQLPKINKVIEELGIFLSQDAKIIGCETLKGKITGSLKEIQNILDTITLPEGEAVPKLIEDIQRCEKDFAAALDSFHEATRRINERQSDLHSDGLAGARKSLENWTQTLIVLQNRHRSLNNTLDWIQGNSALDARTTLTLPERDLEESTALMLKENVFDARSSHASLKRFGVQSEKISFKIETKYTTSETNMNPNEVKFVSDDQGVCGIAIAGCQLTPKATLQPSMSTGKTAPDFLGFADQNAKLGEERIAGGIAINNYSSKYSKNPSTDAIQQLKDKCRSGLTTTEDRQYTRTVTWCGDKARLAQLMLETADKIREQYEDKDHPHTTSTVSNNNAPTTISNTAVTATTSSRLPTTKITIECDAGWGNALYIHGLGANGLTWEKGLPLTWGEGNKWSIELNPEQANVEYKIVMHTEDGQLLWDQKPNRTAEAGKPAAVSEFEFPAKAQFPRD